MEKAPERLKLFGASGMFRESFRVINDRKRLFFQLTLALILPLSLLLLARSRITQLVLSKTLESGYGGYASDAEYPAIYSTKNGWWIALTVTTVFFAVVLVLSLFATSAITYVVACVYTSRDATFKQVVRAVPKVWVRLVITFLWTFLIYIVFTLIFVALIVCAALLAQVTAPLGIALAAILAIAYIAGIVYISVIWQSASVVTVLEQPLCGRKAMSKSKILLKGKMWSVVGCFILLIVFFGLAEFAFEMLVVVFYGSVALRVVFGVIIWFILAIDYLINLTAFTVIYFVCKSYHDENLDLSILLGERPRHEPKDVPVELSNV